MNTFSTLNNKVAVSADTGQTLRVFLANQRGGRKGYLSRVIEEAVRSHILELSAEQAKVSNESIGEDELLSMVDETLDTNIFLPFSILCLSFLLEWLRMSIDISCQTEVR